MKCSSSCCHGRKSKPSRDHVDAGDIKQEPIIGNGSSSKSEITNVAQQQRQQHPQIDSREESSMASSKLLIRFATFLSLMCCVKEGNEERLGWPSSENPIAP